jgi:hypothetical protein
MINNEIIIKYLQDTLGIDTYISPSNQVYQLPYYLLDTYDIQVATLAIDQCLFVYPKSDLEPLTTLKKHLQILEETTKLPIVIILERITPVRRRSLIGARIPFIVGRKQLYLPFIGISLRERQTVWNPLAKNTLMPSAQAILFSCLYLRRFSEILESQIPTYCPHLKYSKMQISRSIKQLEALEIVELHKAGTQIVISGLNNPIETMTRAKPFLTNPCKKRKLYVDKFTIENRNDPRRRFPYAGFSALAQYTFLNAPELETIAYHGNVEDIHGTTELIDTDTQYEVEIWKYAPLQCDTAKDMNVVDPLSLVASLKDYDDPRVEQAIDELLTRGQW